ncbi:MAG: phytanoyl-CoA dioxygenase family protein, partial [Acidobacteria bacterium]|nr:phytanoyl-CoA dioxygenase family protein [Acidobacteriota bacterium]
MDISEQKRSYDRDGFLKVRQLFSPARMDEIESELGRYVEAIVPGLPASDIVYEAQSSGGARAIRNLWRMEQYSRFFADLVGSPELLELTGALVNGEPLSMGVELFAKPAKVGSAVPYHQDNGYFNQVPPDALTCWVAIDDSNLENGCVHYAPGTHRGGLLPHKASMVPGNSWGLAEPPEVGSIPEVPGILSRGDAILHHCC